LNKTFTINPRRLLLLAALGIMAMAVVGYAYSNTVPASHAGDGNGAVSGYTVTNIHYTLDGTNPANTTSVSFTVDTAIPITGTTRLSFDNGSNWLPANACSSSGTTVTCTAVVTVLSLQNLRVVAAQ